jgi:methylenetetrahydrofolate reductase (NADPH)
MITTLDNKSVQPLEASIEIMPKQVLEYDELASLFPRGTWIYLPDIGVDDTDTMVAAARRIRHCGYEPVPHFPVRRISCAEALHERLTRFADGAGITNCLVIAGEAKKSGPYDKTISLLRTGLFDRFGYRKIGIAGHPELNSNYPKGTETQVLLSKAQLANTSDAEFRIVTQFGFDTSAFHSWAESLTEEGVNLPVHLGISGPAKLRTLIKYSARCGVGNSLNFLRKRASALTILATAYNPEDQAKEFEHLLSNGSKSLISQFHVFPFGGLNKTSEWLYERGSWDLSIEEKTACNG